MNKKASLYALSATLFLVGLLPAVALANRIYVGWVLTWTNTSDSCLEGKATTDHGSLGNGYFQFEGRGNKRNEFTDCKDAWNRAAGNYRIRLAAWKTNSSTNCIDTGWVQNGFTTSYMKINRPINPTGNPYANPPCNSGNYWTKGKFETKVQGSWTTGANWVLTDEAHYLPTSPGGNGG
jgi:hypothetical protein